VRAFLVKTVLEKTAAVSIYPADEGVAAPVVTEGLKKLLRFRRVGQ